jgi:hypothetical protein
MIRITKDGHLAYSAYVEDKKTGFFHPTLITASDGTRIPNPEAIRVLRRSSKLRRYLELLAAEVGGGSQ